MPTRCLCSDVAAGGGGGGANSSHAVERDAVIGLYFAFRICKGHEERGGVTAKQYDVAIIGGGMVGLALASALCVVENKVLCNSLLLSLQLMSVDDFVEAVNYALDHGYGPHPQSSSLDHYIESLPWITGPGTLSTREHFEVPPKVINVVSERMAFPLSLMHAHNYASSQVVLIGDAAHAVHPLAGQGVNLGFGDASSLAKVIAEGLSLGADISDVIPILSRHGERSPKKEEGHRHKQLNCFFHRPPSSHNGRTKLVLVQYAFCSWEKNKRRGGLATLTRAVFDVQRRRPKHHHSLCWSNDDRR
ncbi:hypothetical protein GW17_00010867 [Ensete ventricosum]|nr:hypothetical protein GW17_00010867 [Ensete ventricosum]